VGQQHSALAAGRNQSVYPEAIRWAAGLVPTEGVVVAMQFSGAMRAYGWGTLVRYDAMEADRFPEFRRRLEGAGRSFYALLFPWEERDAFARMPGDWTRVGSHRHATLWQLK
jgi:hypothetical protein